MCGILGAYGFREDGAQFGARLDLIAHRGPDAAGVWTGQHAGVPIRLGHRRLSIIDVSEAANQPMAAGDLTIVFNGEIYNFLALRDELAGLGVRFRTRSDTEVLLEGWRCWGPRLLQRLRGMYAFAIFDSGSGELWVARDPFGIKPLYYLWDAARNRLAFASELKALRPLLGPDAEIDPTALCASLLYVWVPEEFCILRGVAKLPPGGFARFRPDAGLTLRRHSDLDELLAGRGGPPAPGELTRAIEESVEAHMIADVPVGTFLSGGLDSSLITAIAAERSRNLECFTIGYRPRDLRGEASGNDLSFARRFARDKGLVLHEIEADPDVAPMLDRLVGAMDEPVGDGAGINVLRICAAARQRGIKVLLSGIGADEAFGGYRRHYAALLAGRYRKLPAPLRRATEAAVAGLPVAGGRHGLKLARWAKRFLALAAYDEEPAYRRSYTYYDLPDLSALTGFQFEAEIAGLAEHHAAAFWRAGRNASRDDRIRRMCGADMQLFLPGLNLTYTDRASMAESTEVRVPYVDREVLGLAFRLSGADKIRGARRKVALTEAARRWLPEYILDRPKASFGLPLRAWTRHELREEIHDLLPNGRLVQAGLLSGRAIGDILRRNEDGSADLAQAIWHLLTLELWFRRNFSDQPLTETPQLAAV